MKQNKIKNEIVEKIKKNPPGLSLVGLVADKQNYAEVLTHLADLVRNRDLVFDGQVFSLPQAGGSAAFSDKMGDLPRILEKYSLPSDFPEAVKQQARRCRDAEKKEFSKRKKVDEWIITIDSETAKDLDDAVSVKQLRAGWELGIHIADVSFYVARGSVLDKESFARGTSVYLNRHVVPMFPHELSDDLCSLNADRPKLALSAFLQVDPTGKVTGSRFEKTLIQVSRRFSYTEVEAILRGKKDPDTDKIQVMAELAKVLRNKRHEQGGLEFEIPEVRITLDDTGDAIGVSIPVRNEAEMMIEDFMLAANEQAASFLAKKGASIFRIHASPDTAKLTEFVKFANGIGLGLRIPTENTPRAMQLLLDAVRGNPHAGVLSSLLLRTMQKAVYSTDNPGHFGLAFADYTHFTSPIRRYPDLVVHRLLASAIEGKKAYTGKELERIAEQATKMEQNAVDAEREYTRIKGARFLGKKIGQVYEGKVTSVTSWGMFITLLDWGLDGLLHISELRDDYYRLDTWGHTLVGERTGRVYSIGSVIKVKIKSVNAEKGFVDLVLEESPERKNGSGKKHTGKSKNGRTHASAPREGDKKREGAKTTKPATGTGKQEPQSRNEQKKQPSVTGQRTGSGRAHPARKPAAKEVTPGRENQRTDSGRSQAVEKKTTAQTSLNQEKKGWRFWKK